MYEEGIIPQINTKQYENIKIHVSRIVRDASKAGYTLNPDAYFLVQDSSGAVSVILADLGIGVYKSGSTNNDSVNNRYADEFLQAIKGVKKY